MKTVQKYIFAFVGLIMTTTFFSSCEPLTDINKNPNEPNTVPTSSLFASAQKNIMNNLRGTGLSAGTSMLFIQYFGHNTYTDTDRYLMTNSTGSSNWSSLYSAIATLNEIIKLNTDPQTKDIVSIDGVNENQIAACRILKVWAFQSMTDIWGDIPYHSTGSDDPDFQACSATEEVVYPKYASQEKIYKDMLKELKEAGNMLTGTTGFKKGDVVFGGNVERWKKLANSLSLRVANRVKDKLPEAANRIQEIINNPSDYPVMVSNSDNAYIPYEATAPNEAPFYTYTIKANRNDYSITHVVVECMQGIRGPFTIDDPRLPKYAQPAKNHEIIIGQPYGISAALASTIGADNVSFPGTTIYASNFKEVIMEYSEVQFILSENKGWDQTAYTEGIKASMEKWGVTVADINTYISSVPVANEETVLTQKWIALMMQGVEAWSEYRRTGYPNFLVMPGDVVWTGIFNGQLTDEKFIPLLGDAIPRRLFYPDTEQSLNKECYQAAISAQGNDTMSARIWWDK